MSLPYSSLDPAPVCGATGLLLMQLSLLLSEQPGAAGESIWEEVLVQPGSAVFAGAPACCFSYSLFLLPAPLLGGEQSACQDERPWMEGLTTGWLSAARSRAGVFTPASGCHSLRTGTSSLGSLQGAIRPPCLHCACLQFHTNLILTLSGLKSSEGFHCPTEAPCQDN